MSGATQLLGRLCKIGVTERLRYFWDMGISGPDFVWAAVGPALESYSAYNEVRRMDGSPFTVSEFLREVRRMVADFALGQILKGQSTEGLDEWSRYYLIHRNLFNLEDAPVGECILLSQGYGLDLNELRSQRGFMLKATSGDVRLAKWDERKRDDLGEPHPGGGLPIVDIFIACSGCGRQVTLPGCTRMSATTDWGRMTCSGRCLRPCWRWLNPRAANGNCWRLWWRGEGGKR